MTADRPAAPIGDEPPPRREFSLRKMWALIAFAAACVVTVLIIDPTQLGAWIALAVIGWLSRYTWLELRRRAHAAERNETQS
jgi:hypothetical protein